MPLCRHQIGGYTFPKDNASRKRIVTPNIPTKFQDNPLNHSWRNIAICRGRETIKRTFQPKHSTSYYKDLFRGCISTLLRVLSSFHSKLQYSKETLTLALPRTKILQ